MKLLPHDYQAKKKIRATHSTFRQKNASASYRRVRRPVDQHTTFSGRSASSSANITKAIEQTLRAGEGCASQREIIAALRQLRETKKEIAGIAKRRGRARGGGRSSKAKGRAAVVLVQELLLSYFPMLKVDDVFVKATSQGGCDLHLSPKAIQSFPFAIEAKNSESLSIWKALAQAEVNARKKSLPAIVFFKRAHSPMYIAMKAEDFLLQAR